MFKKLIWMLLLFPALAFSESDGKKLVNQFWKNTVKKHIHEVATTLSPHFQGMYMNSLILNVGGAITKPQLLQYLLSLNATGFVLSNVRTTKNDHIMVVTYDIQIFTPTPTPYHEIFVYSKRVDDWKLVALSFAPVNAPT